MDGQAPCGQAILVAMRAGLALSLVALAGCAAGSTLAAGQLATFDGRVVLPVSVEVQPLGARRARQLLGLDPALLGVVALEVRVANRTFEPITLPGSEGWAIHDSRAGARVAEGLSPVAAAGVLAAAILAGGGSASPEPLAGRLAGRALAAGVLGPGAVSRGLIYLRPEENVLLDADGLTSRFVVVAIGSASSGPEEPMAGRLLP